MCGSEEQLYKTEIEDTMLNVCKGCAEFGKIVKPIQPKKVIIKEEEKPVPQNETIMVIVDDYSQIIRQKREKLGLNHEDFAKKMNEKVSVIHNIETGRYKPNIDLARKFERFLNVKLIEQHEEEFEKTEATKSDSFKIGDFIKIK